MRGAKGDAAFFQPAVHLLEVFQFLFGDRRQHLHQCLGGGIAEHQVEGGAGGFALAMGMIQQDGIQVREGLVDPGLGGGLLQKFDAGSGLGGGIGCDQGHRTSGRVGWVPINHKNWKNFCGDFACPPDALFGD